LEFEITGVERALAEGRMTRRREEIEIGSATVTEVETGEGSATREKEALFTAEKSGE